jgi:uncharacterized integral membrane protein (TIGR00698 family)
LQIAAWVGLIIALAAGLYYRNPALALLGAMIVRLGLNVNPVPASGTLSKISLQTAIVLLGFTLGFDRLVSVSADYGLIVAIYVLGTLGLGYFFTRWVGKDKTEATLLTGGTAICGGTAIATLAPLLGAKSKQFAVAAALVFLLNVVAVFTFPWIGHALALSQETFGAWVALAVHDTSSVVATAALYGTEAAEVATTVKLGRTLWLIPLAFIVSLTYRQGEAKLRIPGFILLFVVAAGIASFVDLGGAVTSGISTVSKALLVVALAMVGLEIDRETLRNISLSSVLFGVGLWLLVAPLALVLVLFL